MKCLIINLQFGVEANVTYLTTVTKLKENRVDNMH